jgi:hypothetical protein
MITFDPSAAVEAALAAKTEEDLEKEAQWQHEQRAQMRIPTALEVNYTLGRRMADAARKAIENGSEGVAFDQLAQGLSLQGQWGEAVAVAQDVRLRHQLHETFMALTGAQACNCSSGSKFVKQEVLHQGNAVKLLFCTQCEMLQC